jgi:hypothetical protein
MTNFDGINAAYGVAIEEGGPRLPSLQATTYQPRTMSEKVGLCLSEDSFSMLEPEQAIALGCEASMANFGGDDVTVFVLPQGCRFVLMGVPRLFLYDKNTKEFSYQQRGLKLAGTGKVTATRLTLAMLKPDGELFFDENGDVQLFTLKLTSSKTALVTGSKKNPELKSLQDLNAALQKHFGKRGVSLTHLVSIGLCVKAERFSNGSESSIGIMFSIGDAAKPLSEAQQMMTFESLQKPDVLELVQDPFRLKQQGGNGGGSATAADDDYPNYDDIPI